MKKKFEEAIRKYANENREEEVCGVFLLNDFDGVRVLNLKNYHEDKKNFFSIDPKIYLNLQKENKIIAIFHSHTDSSSEPSDYDKKMSFELGVPFYIYSLLNDDFFLYVPSTYQPELMGRQYVEDLQNCTMFVKNYYEQNFNMNCNYHGNFLEIDSKESANKSISTTIIKSGFQEVNKKDLQKDDLILFKGFSLENYFHLGVFDGEVEFYHQPPNGVSKKDILDNLYKRLVYKVYRYKGND